MENHSNIIYNPTYTDEENQFVYEKIANSSEEELVEIIRVLQKLYDEENTNVSKSISDFEKEIYQRDILYQKYKLLLESKAEWSKYIKDLNNHKMALIIQKDYKAHKKEYRKRRVEKYSVFEDFEKKIYEESKYAYFSVNLHKAIRDVNKKNSYKKPNQPHYVETIDEFQVTPLTDLKCLESIGKENLIYLISLLLNNIDLPNTNIVAVCISFLARKYAVTNHKKDDKNFKTSLYSLPDLKIRIDKIFSDIDEMKLKSYELINEIENIK